MVEVMMPDMEITELLAKIAEEAQTPANAARAATALFKYVEKSLCDAGVKVAVWGSPIYETYCVGFGKIGGEWGLVVEQPGGLIFLLYAEPKVRIAARALIPDLLRRILTELRKG